MTFKCLIALAALTCSAAYAQNVTVKDAWVRTAVPGQTATGAFMTLTAQNGARLVGGSTPAASATELHEMKMDGNIMRMRPVQGGLDLPAGQAVQLKPGSYHLMLTGLKAPLPPQGTVPLTLVFQDAKGVQSTLAIQVPVAVKAPGAAAPAEAMPGMPGMKH